MRQRVRSLSTHTHAQAHSGSGVASFGALSLKLALLLFTRRAASLCAGGSLTRLYYVSLFVTLATCVCESALASLTVCARRALSLSLCTCDAACGLLCECVCVCARRVSAFHLLLLPPFRFIRLSARVLYSSNKFHMLRVCEKQKKPLKTI